jgi:scyllo-inositol 2-dehydrogenase (NADP+)
MSAITVGICGIGRFGREHCRYFSQNPQWYRIAAVCDLDEQRVRQLGEEYNAAGYTDFASFLADPSIELVIIATPSLLHASNAAQALAAGKIVLLEKPIGVIEKDYELLQQLVERYPGRLFFCHNHRFEPAFVNAQAIIATGVLGRINVVKLCKHHVFMRRNDWQMRLDCGGGQLSVWGPHLIDQGLQLLGSEVVGVHSYLRRILTPGDGDDHVKITLTGKDDTVVELEISNSAAIAGAYCTIYGDRGAMTYDQDQKKIHMRYLDPEFCWPQATADAGVPVRGKPMAADQNLPWIEEVRAVEPDTNMWSHVEIELVRHLYLALRKQVPFPITSAQALEVLRITNIVKQQNPQFRWL